MEIVPARAKDTDAILDLWGELADFHAGLDAAFTPAPAWRIAYAGYLAALLERPDARVLVARERGRIVAFGVARITLLPPFFAERRRGFIQDVYTVPAQERYTLRKMPMLIAREVAALWLYYLRG